MPFPASPPFPTWQRSIREAEEEEQERRKEEAIPEEGALMK